MNTTIIICTIMICVTIWLSLLTLVAHSIWQTKTGRQFTVELVKMMLDGMQAYFDKFDI